MDQMNHQTLEEYLDDLDVDQDAAEFHGLMTGYLSANRQTTQSKRLSLFEEWLDTRLDSSAAEIPEQLYGATMDSLDEYSDFEFRILLPSDDKPITRRSCALSKWCAGFLSGFGSAGRFEQADLSKEVSEAFGDFSSIAALSDEVPEGEDNEADLMEIIEFVRISVLLIFTECSENQQVH